MRPFIYNTSLYLSYYHNYLDLVMKMYTLYWFKLGMAWVIKI